MILNWLLKKCPKSQSAPKPTQAPKAQPAEASEAGAVQASKTTDMFITQKTTLMGKAMEVARDNYPWEQRYYITFTYPGTNNKIYLEVNQDAREPALRRLILRAARINTDLSVMHYIYKGTPEEVRDYLADSTHIPELLDSCCQLSDSVDKKN